MNPALNVAISTSISLAVMIAEFAWLLRDEVKFVWSRVRRSWYARIYVLSRYLGMASQIFNVYFTFRMYRGVRTSNAGCSVWFAYQAIVVQLLLASAEGILMHRIYALFLRSRIILFILVMFAVGQVAAMGVSARFTLPNVGHTDTCIILKTAPGNAYFGATTFTTQIIIFFMTFSRYFRLPAKWTKQGLGWVVIRDSGASVLGISIVSLFLTLSALDVINTSMSGNITYYWLVCVLWVSIGRLVVNHEKLPREDREGGSLWKSAVDFTSRIELGELALMSVGLEDRVLQLPRHVPASGGGGGGGRAGRTPAAPPATPGCRVSAGELPVSVEPAYVWGRASSPLPVSSV